MTTQAHRVGIVGGGLIGLSWAALFLARDREVMVYDPNPEVEVALPEFAAAAWPALRALGLASSQTPRPGQFVADIDGLATSDFVQECGPDRLAVKRETIAALERVIRPDVVIASSTSALLASDIQAGAVNPERILVGHPMNPPHLVPLVEIVGGSTTSRDAIEKAEAVYAAVDRITVRVQKEVVGHLANRLTSALYREAVHLAAEGIASVADIDRAIAYGPGMRWALMGPHLIYHLGGGAGGYRHYLEHLGPSQEARWRALGETPLTDDVKQLLLDGLQASLTTNDDATLVSRRDAALVQLAKIKERYGF